MVDAKHTPGPWISNSDGSAIKAGKKTVADCISDNPSNRPSRDEILANASLIAAAPYLLAALELAEKKMAENPSFNAWDLGPSPTLIATRAAIARTKTLAQNFENSSAAMVHNPRVTDNYRDEITVSLGGKELRGWSYANYTERRAKMLCAHEYVEGWHDAIAKKGETS